jgi:hypothetical protein
MAALSRSNPDGSITISFTFVPSACMIESEERIQAALHEAGTLATGISLEHFDTDGTPIQLGGTTLTSKGEFPQGYQTPYGEVKVSRHVYQSSQGGATYCPLEAGARIVRTATPLFARQAAFKYGAMNSTLAVADFAEHGRKIARSYLQDLAGDVTTIAADKEALWRYTPELSPGEKVETISLGVDGTCALFCEEGYRHVMVGTIALYNERHERVHATYVARAPSEEGKGAFFEKMDQEFAVIRQRFPQARVCGVADGAHDHWLWLKERTKWQVVDFWHVSEYLAAVAPAMAKGKVAQQCWLDEACHRLKHEQGAASRLLEEINDVMPRSRGALAEAVRRAVSYFTNHLARMDYWFHAAIGLPIGSGITEAACKCVVKERLCGSGMKWQVPGVRDVLLLRTMIKTEGRWSQFWSKVSRFGFASLTRPTRP